MTVSRPKPSLSPSDDSAVEDINGNSTAATSTNNSEIIGSEPNLSTTDNLVEAYTQLALVDQSSIGLELNTDSNDPGYILF